jgi:hypothetical protein
METLHHEHATLETTTRLSHSLLWQLQLNYFDRCGIDAWRSGTVPHHITSSAFTAEAYARVVFGFFRDCHASQHDSSQPLHIVELGSGSGRFAYLFLKRFLSLYRKSVFKDIPFTFVMTDFTEQNLEYWRTHKWLRPFVEAGVLDFARFDVEGDDQLRLIHSGEVLSPETLRNPLVAIANYLFDSIPQDAFSIADGQLCEKLLTLTTPDTELDSTDPELLSRVKLDFQRNPVSADYYDDPTWNRLLLDYKQRFCSVDFLFPTAALRCIRNLNRLSNRRLLLLSGDRGYTSDEALLRGEGQPTIAVHGSFSMMVDYQILGENCRLLGGQVMHPKHTHDSLNVSAFMFGNSGTDFIETRLAYDEAIERLGPDDFFTLKSGLEEVYPSLSLDQLLAFLRLSGWDYKRFCECLPIFKERLDQISGRQKQQLHDAILNVWDSYLPIGEINDLAFELGTLLLEMDLFPAALEFLQHSVELYGEAPGTAYNMAVCFYNLGMADQAVVHCDRALALAQDFEEARTLRTQCVALLPRTARRSARTA